MSNPVVTMNDHQKLHFVLVPLMAQGHMIPMVDIAQLLADRGVVVSVITTPFNASRIKATIDRLEESGLPIHFVQLRFPCAEAGLPEGCENIDVLPSRDLGVNFISALPLLREPLILYLRQQHLRPSCIVSDRSHPWTQEVAVEFGIPRLTFHGFSGFASLCSRNIREHKILESITDQTQSFVVPDLSPQIEITKEQAAPGFFSGPSVEKLRNEIVEAEKTSAGVIINSFYNLEAQYIESYQKITGKKAWTIGPVSLYNKDPAYRIARGNRASVDKEHCLSWLDSMKPRSVVYVSFGSIARTSSSQVVEIGLGLEASNYPFIWVIRAGDKGCEVERWLSEGFEERTKGRSLIIRGWAPQVTILSHPAVGGFMTHCGWNSTLESISVGVPMVTWPQFAEQFFNEKLVVEVLGVGVSVGVKTPTQWEVNGAGGVQVRGEEIERAVRKLMDEGEVGEEIRKRAGELGEMARKAVEFGGSSYVNISHLIQEILHHASCKKNMLETKASSSEGVKDECMLAP